MKRAIISLLKENPDSGMPIGLMPLMGSTIAENQIASARRMGAQKITVLTSAMHGELLRIADSLQRHDFTVDAVRSVEDIRRDASDEDDALIFLSDGIIPSTAIEQQIAALDGEELYVVETADEFEGFERIDLSHRWLGVASLKTARLADIADIPDDWDIGSALLRTAIQADCPRAIIAADEIQNGAVAQLTNVSAIDSYTRFRLKKPPADSGNFLERFVIRPIIGLSLRPIWKSDLSPAYFTGTAVCGGLLACVLAYFSWPVTALVALILGVMTAAIANSMEQFSPLSISRRQASKLYPLLAQIAILLIAWRLSQPLVLAANMVITLLLLINLALLAGMFANRRMSPAVLTLAKPDLPLIILILLLSTVFGAFFAGLYFCALYAGIIALAEKYFARKASENQ